MTRIHVRLLVAPLALLLVLITPGAAAAQWPQDAGNPQRTGSTTENPAEPWTYLWSWNGADSNGGTGNHFYDAPAEARTVAAEGKIFIPAGDQGLYARNLTNGAEVWHLHAGTFNAAPVWSNGYLFAGDAAGTLYRINDDSGEVTHTYDAGSALNKALLAVGEYVYATSNDGKLHKLRAADLSSAWVYTAESNVATPPSYSASRDIIIYATDNLYVHAVNNADGSRKWRIKPTPNSPGGTSQRTAAGAYLGNQFELGWPVVADVAGVVLLRMQLPHEALFQGPNGGKWSRSNSENRSWLVNNPEWQNLFALNLDTGAKQFIPVVGYGSTEDYYAGEAQGVMGSQPVVVTLANGKQVAYIHFRNGAHDSDFRWSGHLGEMVLDDDTVPGLAAGDLRFVESYGYEYIVDEQNPLTMAGDTLFHSHWGAVSSMRITNRSNNLGLEKNSPIATVAHPPIVRAAKACGTMDAAKHWSTCGLDYVTDGGRFFAGPGWWGYWNVPDPPGWRVGSGNSADDKYSAGFQARYTYVAEGKIIVQGNGGDILVFRHSDSSGPSEPTPVPSSTPDPTPNPTSTPVPTFVPVPPWRLPIKQYIAVVIANWEPISSTGDTERLWENQPATP